MGDPAKLPPPLPSRQLPSGDNVFDGLDRSFRLAPAEEEPVRGSFVRVEGKGFGWDSGTGQVEASDWQLYSRVIRFEAAEEIEEGYGCCWLYPAMCPSLSVVACERVPICSHFIPPPPPNACKTQINQKQIVNRLRHRWGRGTIDQSIDKYRRLRLRFVVGAVVRPERPARVVVLSVLTPVQAAATQPDRVLATNG